VFELCRTYNLDISSRLENQHRMLPAISKLLVPHIYEKLVDHESVMRYPLIRGVSSNMFFINHERMEVSVTDGHSKVNEHEAMILVELCRHLLKQGYNPNQITIRTTYSGQLFGFKKKMPRSEFTGGVRVSTVDNYQGEENDILLLSLVRSNKEGAIGFLGIDNRVCVALSRAKHDLYCIGNFSHLCSKSVLKKKILNYVHREKMVGDGILMQCQQHPKYEQVRLKLFFNELLIYLYFYRW
jgi:superfamily I DNA and/or RNA helicase